MKIIVTGANGHLGTNLVGELLAAGHTVRGSVRYLGDEARTAHLRALGPVELVEADLSDPKSLREAMDGQDALLHTAAVYALYAPGQDDAIVRASVDGIDAALRAAKDAGVKRVIVTSSVVALPLSKPDGDPVGEQQWASDLRVPYVRGKTEGERRAWVLADELGQAVEVLLPHFMRHDGVERRARHFDAEVQGEIGRAHV